MAVQGEEDAAQAVHALHDVGEVARLQGRLLRLAGISQWRGVIGILVAILVVRLRA
jgi:hypothetical protein